MNEKCSRKNSQEHTRGKTNTFAPVGKTTAYSPDRHGGKKLTKKFKKAYILHTEKPGPRIKARWGRTRYNEYTDQGEWSSISTQGCMNLFLLWGEFVWKSTRISINCRIETSTWISVSASNQLSVILYLSYSCFVNLKYRCRYLAAFCQVMSGQRSGCLAQMRREFLRNWMRTW